jgi:hypothetical protein
MKIMQSEIMSKPEQFVEPDPELPLALLDQKEVYFLYCYNFCLAFDALITPYTVILMKQAGKKLVLITNSDFHYTDKMMRHSFNRFLPNDMGWRDLFEIVSSYKLLLQ